MRALGILSAMGLLAACSQGNGDEPAPAPEMELQSSTEGAGVFDYSSPDGTATGRMDMRADGTYTDYQYGAEPRTGTWYATEGQTCMTGDAEGSVEMCWTDSEADENGMFTSTSPDGEVVNVTPVTDAAAS